MEWKTISEFEGLYEASSTGKIRSLSRTKLNRWNKEIPVFEKELIPQKVKGGYLQVTLSKYGICYRFSVHRLIADTFIPNPNSLPDVNHKDGNKENNNVSNLEWCTEKQNYDHAIKIGLIKKVSGADKITSAKLTTKEVLEIRASASSNEELSNKYNVSTHTINSIKKKLRWKHL